MDWILSRIKQKYVEVKNPFNRFISYISLDPKDVRAWVWWSKDFKNWIECYNKNSEVFKQFDAHFFNFTINSQSELEVGLRTSLDERINQMKWLIEKFGVDSIQWRFDPIVLYIKLDGKNNYKEINNQLKANTDNYEITIKNEDNKIKFQIMYNDLEIHHNLNDFDYISKNLSKFGIDQVVFSFASIYKKVFKRMFNRRKLIIDIPLDLKLKILSNLIKISKNYKIKLYSCCQPELLKLDGIKQSHCIDGEKIQRKLGYKIKIKRDNGQRTNCLCNISKDIGGYDGIFKCKHNCDYCYAHPSL